MNTRREFLVGATAAVSLTKPPPTWASGDKPEVALTFDDPSTRGGPTLHWQELNQRILETLAQHNLRSVLFVCGMRVDSVAGRELVASWDHNDHLIGNHSYSHLSFGGASLTEYEQDAVKNEPLVSSYTHFVRLFRYPQFKEGNTVEKRDGMRAFLKQHGYRIGRATIDASDWAINLRLEARLEADAKADVAGYRDFFLQHIWERSAFYQSLAQHVVKRPVRHTVLLHHNTLNALFLSDLIGMFAAKGWRVVDAEYAYQDPVYDRQPRTLPAGEGLMWALAKESGRFEHELRYPGEDDVYENPRMDALKL